MYFVSVREIEFFLVAVSYKILKTSALSAFDVLSDAHKLGFQNLFVYSYTVIFLDATITVYEVREVINFKRSKLGIECIYQLNHLESTNLEIYV